MKTPTEAPPGYEWQIVRSYDEFRAFITQLYLKEHRLPDMISFDHDLADEHLAYLFTHGRVGDYGVFKEKTGMHCAKWLIETCTRNEIDLREVKLCVHSDNPGGTANIQSYINSYKRVAYGADKADCFTMKWPFAISEADRERINKLQEL